VKTLNAGFLFFGFDFENCYFSKSAFFLFSLIIEKIAICFFVL